MTRLEIRSSDNGKIKRLRQLLHDSSERRAVRQFVIEGRRFVKDAIVQVPELINTLVLAESGVSDALDLDRYETWVLDDRLFKSLSTIGTSEGWMAIARVPGETFVSSWTAYDGIIVLDGVQKPENVGAIVRNAAAFNYAVVALAGTCDFFHTTAVRAMAGNWFQVPLIVGDADTLSQIDAHGFEWVFLDGNASRSVSEIHWGAKTAIVMGSEGSGIRNPQLDRYKVPDNTFRIDLQNGVESLNVAVASGIVCHARRCASTRF